MKVTLDYKNPGFGIALISSTSSTLTNSNGYIALCNNALSSIPASIWIIWANALKAIFGIIISALFLKILINWAT